MAKIDETYLRNTFKIHPDVKSARISPYISAASRRLQRMIHPLVYSSTDPDVEEIVKLTEATLAMHFMTLNLNTSIRPNGLIKTEAVENNVTLNYLSPTETAQTASAYFEQAEELIREFLGSDIPAAPEFVETDINYEGTIYPEWQT